MRCRQSSFSKFGEVLGVVLAVALALVLPALGGYVVYHFVEKYR